MAIIKCKMCGGDIELSPDKTFGTCEYCGSTMTFPKIDDEHRAEAFNRGNHFRRIGEFDKALTVYERIVQEGSADAEAHWCCALCRFGIEYVKDPASGEYLPTCHRTSFDSFLEDIDCRAALEHADAVTREQYRKDAKQIAAVQRRIMSTVQKEAPFDVFICYKETGADGSRTVDSTLAQDIYYRLTEEGRRVFFARITLEDKAGQEYEPYIFAALHSAKVMLVVGTKPEHFNAVWVKNEWSRYLALMKNDRKRLLIPCYRDMDPYDLPEQLAVLQSYDMGRIGFIQDLIRGVSKVLGVEKAKPEAAKETVVVQSESGGNLTALLKRGNMALEDGEWDKADGFFEQVLNLDAECAEAYFGKALAVRKCSDAKQFISQEKNAATRMRGALLAACPVDEEYITQTVKDFQIHLFLTEETIRSEFEKFDRTYESMEDARRQEFRREQNALAGDKLFSKAVRYAKDGQTVQAQKEILDTYQARIDDGRRQDKEKAGEITRKYAEFLEITRQEIEKRYSAALEKREAVEQGARLARQRKARNKKIAAIAAAVAVLAVAAFLVTTKVIIPGNHYKQAEALLEAGSFDEAVAAFEALGDYKDAGERALDAQYQKLDAQYQNGMSLLNAGSYDEAATVFKSLGNYNDAGEQALEAQYQKGMSLLNAGSYDEAATVFAALGDYNDAGGQTLEAKYQKGASLLNAGSYDEAATVFAALGDYKDADEQALDAQYQNGTSLFSTGNYGEAASAFEALDDYNDAAEKVPEARYLEAEDLLEAGNSFAATISFAKAKDYQDAQARCSALWNEIAVRETIAAGSFHTVGLKSNGTVVAVGHNNFDQCDVGSWTDIVTVSVGAFHTVGLKSDGIVVAVGDNRYGECDVEGWTDIVAVSAGSYHTVGLKSNGTVVAVGDNLYGQCNVKGWTDIVAVSAGNSHTVGLKSDGTVVAVGDSKDGRCDAGSWTDIVAVSADYYHTVGLKSDGTVVAVGHNSSGECDVSNWTDIVAVAAGGGHTVGLKSDGTVVAVGHNVNGQCDVGSWTDIVEVAAGCDHTVALKSDGTVVAVGYNKYGVCDVGSWTGIKLP